MTKRYRISGFGVLTTALALLLGYLMYLIWTSEPPKPKVIATVSQAKTEAIPDPEGCLPEGPATLIAVKSEKTNLGNKEGYKPEDWAWSSTASFLTDDKLTIVCSFEFLKLDDVWAKGARIFTTKGKREVGEYDMARYRARLESEKGSTPPPPKANVTVIVQKGEK